MTELEDFQRRDYLGYKVKPNLTHLRNELSLMNLYRISSYCHRSLLLEMSLT